MSLKNMQYIVFDLNGTLVHENYCRHDMVLENLLKCKRRGRRLTVDDLRQVSKGKLLLSEVIAKLYLVDDPDDISRRFLKIQAARITFRENALNILKILQTKQKLILCSDTTGIAKEVVQHLNLAKFFIKTYYSCDVGYLKSEEMFWTNLLSQFPQAKSQDFVTIGDNPRADIYHPNRLGMHTILIWNPQQQSFDYREQSIGLDKETPEYRIKKLEEILLILNP